MWQNRVKQFGIEAKTLVPVKNLLDSDFWPEDFVVRVSPLEEQEQEVLLDSQQSQQQTPAASVSVVPDEEAVQSKGFIVKKIDSAIAKPQRLGIVKKVDAAARTCVVRWMDREVMKEVQVEGRKRKRWEGETEEVSFYEIMCHPDFTYSVGTVVLRLPSQGEVVELPAPAEVRGDGDGVGGEGVDDASEVPEMGGKIVSRPPSKNKKRGKKKGNQQQQQRRGGELLFEIEEPGDSEEEEEEDDVPPSKNQRKKAQRRKSKNEQQQQQGTRKEKEKDVNKEKEKEKETNKEKEKEKEEENVANNKDMKGKDASKPAGPARHGWVGQITKIKGGQLQILWADKKVSWLDPDAVYALDR